MKLSEWVLKITDHVTPILGRISRAGDEAARKFLGAEHSMHKFQEAMSESAHEVPGLSMALNMIKNPFVLATAGAVGVFEGLHKAVEAATEFNDAFLKLEHLNQHKSEEELHHLKGEILDTAMAYGLKADAVANAYYKIQSLTAKEGEENLKIVGRVGEFARSVQADVAGLTTNVAKAMGIFHFGQEGIDRYLQSMGKLVQTSELSWEEANKGVIVFQSFAQAVNQSADEAFKMYSYLGKRAGDFSTAAYETRGVLESLVNPHIMKGLKTIGVHLYDASGKMRTLTDISAQLHKVFQKAGTDKAIDQMIAKMGRGAEGFKAYIGAIKKDYAGMMETFSQYDTSEFSIEKAIKTAGQDYSQLKEIFSNETNTIMIKLGQVILPDLIRGLESLNQWISKNGAGMVANFEKYFGALKLTIKAVILPLKELKGMSDAKSDLMHGNFKKAWNDVADPVKNIVQSGKNYSHQFDEVKENTLSDKTRMDNIAISKIPGLFKELMGMSATQRPVYIQMLKDKGVLKPEPLEKEKKGIEHLKNPKDLNVKPDNTKFSDATSGVSGDSKPRIINIRLDNLIGTFNVNSHSVKEATNDIRRVVLETVARAINGAEQAVMQ